MHRSGARIELRIEIRLWAACLKNHGSIPSKARHFLLLQSIQTSHRSHPAAHYSVGMMWSARGGLSPRLQWLEHIADYSPPSCAKAKNKHLINFHHQICHHRVHVDNLTFTFTFHSVCTLGEPSFFNSTLVLTDCHPCPPHARKVFQTQFAW